MLSLYPGLYENHFILTSNHFNLLNLSVVQMKGTVIAKLYILEVQ